MQYVEHIAVAHPSPPKIVRQPAPSKNLRPDRPDSQYKRDMPIFVSTAHNDWGRFYCSCCICQKGRLKHLLWFAPAEFCPHSHSHSPPAPSFPKPPLSLGSPTPHTQRREERKKVGNVVGWVRCCWEGLIFPEALFLPLDPEEAGTAELLVRRRGHAGRAEAAADVLASL